MDKKKVQKLNKAVVATVLAGSGVVVTAPMLPTKANTQFNDLNPDADYYQPVMELASRGYISGYEDGTFRPNQAITRGQAAKMLAMALNLNTTNPTNPGFRDVPTNHYFYKYIAALANEGVISGFDDKTFRPNEPINRNQMAKILALGYKFQVSTKQTHSFADISESNANRYFIQTLYDLGIAKGTTGITYSPFESVTRGQLATFIIRAENTSAENVKLIKEIGEVVGADVYINGIKYRVDASLRDIINDTNAAALKGAHIEGQIVGETLKTISSLTLNAQGTANRMLTFDGNNTTFTGELKVQGNYIIFKNWTLSGPVTIAETPRRTLSDLANVRIASITGFGFIDWNKPTDKTEEDDDPTYNEGGNDLTDKPAIDTGGRSVDRMPVTEKYVDFSNSSVQRLIIEVNRTYVAATTKIPYVSVQGEVRQFEIYANIGTLYIEPDVKTTMFGVGDIDTIYKNSFKDVFFNTDSYVKLMVVDHSGGWIDLGDYFYVDKVIIPPNKMPNNIFNDFIKDNDKIGDIENPNGNDVDRDPIENTIIPDMEAPTAQIGEIKVQGSSMTAGIKSSEDGEYFYTIRKADDRIPTMREIIEEAETTTLKTSGTGWIEKDKELTITASGLEENAEYVLYLVTKDEADNYSDKVSKAFTTMDGTPPRIDDLDVTALPGGKRATVSFNASEAGQYYYRLVPKTGATEPPTVDDVINGSDGNGIAVEGANTIRLEGLTHLTEYTIYMVMVDSTGNKTVDVVSDTFTTRELDATPPTVNPDIKIVGNTYDEPTIIQLTFSEMMDPETAEKIENYILSGTGNLTGNPYSAKLERDGRTVTLQIPSMAAFVNNDTLIVTVQNVTDIAGNTILKGESTSVAKYTHQTNTRPVIESLEANSLGVNGDGVETIETEFSTKLTGTYYYMIVPITPTENNPPENIFKVPEISQVVFPQDYKLPVGSSATVINVNSAPVNQPVLLNNQTILYGKGTANELVNSFKLRHSKVELNKNKTGYKIYMVLQDRNGNYSALKEADYIKDNEKPQIIKSESYFVNPNDKSKSFDNFFYSDAFVPNGSEIFEFQIKFSEPMDPESIADRTKYKLEGLAAEHLSIDSVTMGADSSTAVVRIKNTGTLAFREYLLEQGDNLSIKVDGVLDFNKLQPANDVISFNYVDKVKPIIKPNDDGITAVRYYPSGSTNSDVYIKLTFRENIGDFAAEDFNITSLGQNYTVASVDYAKDERNRNIESELVLKVEGVTLNSNEEFRDLTIKVSDGVKDEHGNTMYVADGSYNEAIYRYRNIKATIKGTELESSRTTSTGGVKSSPTAYILTDIVGQGERAKYYFTVRSENAARPSTLQDIINSNRSNSSAFGSAEVETVGARQLLDAVETSGNLAAVFIEGYILYLVVVDEYNNVSNIDEMVIKPFVSN